MSPLTSQVGHAELRGTNKNDQNRTSFMRTDSASRFWLAKTPFSNARGQCMPGPDQQTIIGGKGSMTGPPLSQSAIIGRNFQADKTILQQHWSPNQHWTVNSIHRPMEASFEDQIVDGPNMNNLSTNIQGANVTGQDKTNRGLIMRQNVIERPGFRNQKGKRSTECNDNKGYLLCVN